MSISSHHRGFTIVELLIALSFFSFLLMALTVGFVQINRAYTKGITVKTIQENGRVLMNDITRAIRSSGEGSISSVPRVDKTHPAQLCIGGIRYGWNQYISGTLTSDTYSDDTLTAITMVKTNVGNCSIGGFSKTSSETVIDKRAIVQYFAVTGGANGVWRVKLVLSTSGTSDLLENPGELAKCQAQVGNQFCDIASFETVVSVRN